MADNVITASTIKDLRAQLHQQLSVLMRAGGQFCIDLARSWWTSWHLAWVVFLKNFIRLSSVVPLGNVGFMLIAPCLGGVLSLLLAAVELLPARPVVVATVSALASLAFAIVLVDQSSRPDIKELHDSLRDRRRQMRQVVIDSFSQLADAQRNVKIVRSRLRTAIKDLERQERGLFSRDWRGLRAVEFEEFLVGVLQANSGTVERTKVVGDQGVDLIVYYQRRKIAIQAKGYSGTVGNYAVQEVVAGMRFYNCDCCAVITNSDFSTGAFKLAEMNQCAMVDQTRLPELIRGKMELIL